MRGVTRGKNRWYIFIHQLPPRPLYLRAKVRRLLSQAGALPLKDSVYLLPCRGDLLPELQHVVEVATSGGGHAYVGRGEFIEHPGHEELVSAFRRARDDEYRALVAQVGEWTARLDKRSGASPPEGPVRLRLAHARKALARIARIDFFAADLRREAERAVAELESRLRAPASASKVCPPGTGRELRDRTWVTRQGIQVDRIASAWLIRRFLDPTARFRFIDLNEEEPRPGELTFDMAGADFTHEEDRCTFETLVRKTRLRDPALMRVAEIVHDIDIKDGKFGRPEARGIEQLLLGMLRANPEDEARLDRGFGLLDDLHRSFARPVQAGFSSPGGGGGAMQKRGTAGQ